MLNRLGVLGLACGALLAGTGVAEAATVIETTDAGVTMATATTVTTRLTSLRPPAAGAANRIVLSGTLDYVFDENADYNADVDLYRFEIDTDGLYRFFATDSLKFNDDDGRQIDDNLLLFDSLGRGLAGDDDDDEDVFADDPEVFSLDSVIQLRLTAGTYYLGYGDNNIAAFVDFESFLNEEDFIDNDDGTLDQPTQERLGLIGPEFNGVYDRGTYKIIASAVPEPATWAMMIGGFGFVGGAMRRGKRAAPALA